MRKHEMNERVANYIREYDAQGWHRTGTEIDLMSATWLAQQVNANGFEAHKETFDLSRITPVRNFMDVDGTKIEGLPLFDGSFTGDLGIQGKLGVLNSQAEIGLAEVSPIHPHDALEQARSSGRHRALIAVTLPPGGKPGLAPQNAPRFAAPFGPPVLQVDTKMRGWLFEKANNQAHCQVVAEVKRTDAKAVNVTTIVHGRDPSLPPVIVMTPRSGWWQCASERGGGIACWLEMIRSLGDNRPSRDVRFVATSGHELGHLGLKAYLRRNPNLATGALAWIHLGASIGAAENPTPRLAALSKELQQLAAEVLVGHAIEMPEIVPIGVVPGGESRDIHEKGGRYISLAGGHATFHQEADRWPDAVNVDSVVRYASALVDVLARISGDTGPPSV